MRRATFDLQQGNDRDASLAARSILEMNPSSAAAARIMAELGEKIGERAALDWRRKAAQLDPHSVDDQLALVRSSVQFDDIATAERALAGVEENGRTRADYHAAVAAIALAKHEDEKAEAEWTEALRLRPGDTSYQLRLGTMRVRARDPQKRADGEAMLNALRSDPGQRSAATRALINAGIAQRDDSRKLLDLARELQSYPEAIWSDRFLYLDFLHAMKDPKFSEYLTELTQTEMREYFRGNLWPNTPDILHETLQKGGRPAFMARLVLAATLGANYGIYGPPFELCENDVHG